MGKPSSVNLLVQTRTKMKSHKAAANRFIKELVDSKESKLVSIMVMVDLVILL